MTSETHRRRLQALVIALVALVIGVALVFGYAGGWGLFAGPAAAAEKLRIALPTAPHAALLYIAVGKGYFADEGLDVTVTLASTGKAALERLAQGEVDLASASEVPFVISVLNGERLGIVAAVASASNEIEIVARRDRAIAAPRDLVGKKVGATFGTSGEYSLWAFLIRHKLAPDSVTLVDVPPGQMVHELTSGRVDAVSTPEPIKSAVQAALADNALSFSETDAYTGTQVVIGRSEFLKTHPGVIEKLVRALLKAEGFSRSEPQQALRLVAAQLQIDARVLEPGWEDFEFKVGLHQSQLITLEDEAHWAMERGYAGKRPLPNFLPHLHLDALLAVQPERVTVVR